MIEGFWLRVEESEITAERQWQRGRASHIRRPRHCSARRHGLGLDHRLLRSSPQLVQSSSALSVHPGSPPDPYAPMAMTVGTLPSSEPVPVKERAPPPTPSGSYSPKHALDDLPGTQYALELFLASHMVECEEYLDKCDPKKERLYCATGFGLIQTVKALMSFEDNVRVQRSF